MIRWAGIGLAVPLVVLAVTALACLAADRSGSSLDEAAAAVSEPAGPADVPVRFEVDRATPGAGPVLTR